MMFAKSGAVTLSEPIGSLRSLTLRMRLGVAGSRYVASVGKKIGSVALAPPVTPAVRSERIDSLK